MPKRDHLLGAAAAPKRSSIETAFVLLAQQLAQVGFEFYRRGWTLGTSGNFSAVAGWDPLRLLITSTGLDKGALNADQFVAIDQRGAVVGGAGEPSAEARLHLTIVHHHVAGAVLHTHSLWSTILSDHHASEGGLAIEGYEMLKGLAGVVTHEHREWLPILENSQDMDRLAGEVEKILAAHPAAHGFLIRRHGMYTWGKNLAEAKRHVEILEFLLEVLGQSRGAAALIAPG